METNLLEKSNGEPNSKRPKMETEGSTSSKPESKDPFLSLPSDVLVKIIAHTPVAQWPALELLDKNFRAATWIAWRQLRNVNVDRDFLVKPEKLRSPSALGKTIVSILQKLVERSSYLSSLSGISIHLGNAEMNSNAAQLLAQFEHLQSITIGKSILFYDRPGIRLEDAIEFLDLSRSRTSLTELQLFNVVEPRTDRATIRDRFASSFVIGREIQSPLKLEKFTFASSYTMFDPPSFSIRLDTMDTTRLTDLRVGKTAVEPDQLINLIERASHLLRIELSCLHLHHDSVCNDRRLQPYKELLTTLASHQNLMAIKFAGLFGNGDLGCLNFGPELIQMLKSIGRHGQLRKFAIDDGFVPSPTVDTDMDEVCSTICNYIPYLQSIKLHSINHESVLNIVSLPELEEYRVPEFCTPDVIRKVAQLPRLKRLAIRIGAVDEDSLECLADVTTLTDFRVRHCTWISAGIYEKWSDGFASNLQILILGGVAEEVQHEGGGLVHLLAKAVRLRVLLLKTSIITDQVLMAIANSCPDLETLGVRSYHRPITVRHLQEIVDRCPKLKRLGAGCGDEVRKQLRFPKYRKIDDVNMDVELWGYDFDDGKFD